MPDGEIIPENLLVVQAIYFAYMLEETRLFQVVDRIVELSQRGLLPLGRRVAAPPDRMTEQERTDLYLRTFGAPGGDADAEPNHDFSELWLRFVASVAVFGRQVEAADAHFAPSVRTAAGALALGASARGAGIASAARRLASDVHHVIALLRDPAIAQALGARDMWEVIDRVNTDYLGGAVDTSRYRTLGEAGSAMLRWLAANAQTLDRPADDGDLLNAVEQWVAVSGIHDNAAEQYSQPTESLTLRPATIDLPAVVRDLLDAVGATDSRAAPPGVVLFCGPGGTGKTLAAYMIAQALGIDLLRIDLGRVVSQWIGDTERHLNAIFAPAQASDAALFFDEADALFGKRTELDDAHDRYANIDTAYLLRRMEAHDGLVMVATDAHSAIDEVLREEHRRRRVRTVICFPRPRQ